MNLVDVADLGPAVVAILRDPAKFADRVIPLYGDAKTFDEYLSEFTEVTGVKASVVFDPIEVQAQSSPQLAVMFDWFNKYGVYGPGADLEACKREFKPTSWKDWLKKTGFKG
eukprot:TRINITY_DN4406_c1_g1_i1.p3 TRINITY_DN4406_c1_g1~~TRINITY_DN4406_c1_g1_i1.p3  ORF type:complete len:112 (+),score=57.65 TRINITY_DN4406_c1_g1_i1:169-504(+)